MNFIARKSTMAHQRTQILPPVDVESPLPPTSTPPVVPRVSATPEKSTPNMPTRPPPVPMVPWISATSEKSTHNMPTRPPPPLPQQAPVSPQVSAASEKRTLNMPTRPSPPVPLVAQGSTKSEKRVHILPPQPQPLLAAAAAPPVTRGSMALEKVIPIQHHTLPPPKQRSCCCKIICWTIGLLILLIILIGATVGTIYLVFRPKPPNYSINNLSISDLRLNYDLSLYAKFDVKITANNPNKKIGIYYEKGGRLSVWYSNNKLCEGSLPKFYQGHQNITKLDVSLTGQNQYGSTIFSALQQQQTTGSIPLDLKVSAPVSIKLGGLKLRKVKVLGQCNLVVDSLSANNLISIKASNCRFRLKL